MCKIFVASASWRVYSEYGMSYESYTGRHFGELQNYADIPQDRRNIIDMTRQAAAGVIHFGTSLIESPLQDVARKIEGNTDPIPEFQGDLPRARESATGVVRNLTRFKLLSAAVQAIKLPGDLFADVVGDKIIGGINRSPVQ